MSLADVQSANVVGYNNISLRSGRYMTGSNFDKITKAGMRLTDLRPTGYEDITYWSTGKGNGKFNDIVTITLLSYQGKALREWKWLASYNKDTSTWNEGYWYDAADTSKTPIVPGSDADHEFEVGEGLWVNVDPNAYSKPSPKPAADKYKLVNSGQAMLDSQTIPLRSGRKGIIAPLSRAVRLTEIKPTGYEDITYWSTGKGNGKFNDIVTITLLTYQGKALKEWKWLASYNKDTSTWNSGYWYDVADTSKTPIEPGTEADYQFDLGEGLWVNVDPNAYSKPSPKPAADKYLLSFPGLDEDNRVTE